MKIFLRSLHADDLVVCVATKTQKCPIKNEFRKHHLQNNATHVKVLMTLACEKLNSRLSLRAGSTRVLCTCVQKKKSFRRFQSSWDSLEVFGNSPSSCRLVAYYLALSRNLFREKATCSSIQGHKLINKAEKKSKKS